ncbi:hypothetical protein ACIBO2_19975 [Nonomuraea sp. NPDC050022]|uniref:hypothetical protein n=1 Tax=Nonomuraea sp. NPDC050022 TaxID=3364358 RepID=UPI003790EA5E
MGRIADRFCRVEPRRTARAYLSGLLSGIERKDCWWPAEHAGLAGPQAVQRLLRTASPRGLLNSTMRRWPPYA